MRRKSSAIEKNTLILKFSLPITFFIPLLYVYQSGFVYNLFPFATDVNDRIYNIFHFLTHFYSTNGFSISCNVINSRFVWKTKENGESYLHFK